MRNVVCLAVSMSAIASASVSADTLSVQSALTHATVGGGECHLGCDALEQGFCDLTCDNVRDSISEYSNVNVTLTAISINAAATADVTTFEGRTVATAEAGYDVQFTLTQSTYVYVTWNIFYPPAQTNFLPKELPAGGVWVGELPAGAYFIADSLFVQGTSTQNSGLLLRIIPNIDADCDADGTPDWQELVDGSQVDVDNDGVPDECSSDPADLNNDGVINAADLAILLGQWGGAGSADLDRDGGVNAADLAILLGAWS